MRRWGIAALALAACGGSGGDGSDLLEAPPTEAVVVTFALREDVPTFKVEGRLAVTLERLPPFAGSVELEDVVIDPGERSVTRTVTMPPVGGRLVARERTFTDRVPYLCGETIVDPRTQAAATMAIDLCLP